MSATVPELVSIELSQRCQKGCHFCYNGSGPDRQNHWVATDVVRFVKDLARHGTQAVSLGGGEPLEYDALEEVFEQLRGVVFLSMTTNGLLLDEQWSRVSRLSPNKVHVSIHFPHNEREVERVIRQVTHLRRMGIRAGVNLLVRADRVDAARVAAQQVRAAGIGNDAIVYLPMRGSQTPSPTDIGDVAGSTNFQSMTCLMACGRSARFCSIDAEQRAAHCSYTTSRRALPSLDAWDSPQRSTVSVCDTARKRCRFGCSLTPTTHTESMMLNDRETYAPLILFEYDDNPGNYCLLLSDNHMVDVMDVFEENGRYGNGYGWADVALCAMRENAPELEERMGIDPEAGMFVAYGEDLEALQKLGELLRDAFHDKAKLAHLAANAPWEYD